MYFKEIDVSRETMHSFDPKRVYEAPYMPKNSKKHTENSYKCGKMAVKRAKSHLIALKTLFYWKTSYAIATVKCVLTIA